jgi:methyl-accepting chemotaxis protein
MAIFGFIKSLDGGSSSDPRAIVEALDRSQATIQFSADGTILTANENFLGAMGYTLDEIKGKHHSMFVEKGFESTDEYRNFWSELRAGKFQQAEYKRIGKGGKEVWIQASYNPILNSSGKVEKVVKFATDVTADKLKEAFVEGQIAAINRSQAVIEFEPDGKIVTANDHFLAAVGYSLDEIKGKHHSMFVEKGFETTDEYRKFWSDLRDGKFQQAEYKRIGKGGREIWIQATYSPILDMDGRVFRVVKFATDVTKEALARDASNKAIKVVNGQLDGIGDAVERANREAATAAAASESAATTVQSVAAGAEELDSSVQEIARSTSISTEQVSNAIQQVASADTEVQNLSRNAEAMGSIVSLIQDIASQINLLALNATIESARAGEAGKGFAVVANEVKSLANQVASATGQISTEIESMQTVSRTVVESLGSISAAVSSVETSVTGVASAVEEQAAVTREISESMQTATTAVQEIDSSIQSIRESVEVADVAAKSVRQELAALV